MFAEELQIKPLHHAFGVLRHLLPATVAGILADDELADGADFVAAFQKALGLREGDLRIGVAMDDEDRRLAFVYPVDRRQFTSKRLATFRCGRFGSKSSRVGCQLTDADGVVTRLEPVQVIGGRIKTGDGIHGAAFAINGVRCLRVAQTATSGEHQAEVPTRAAASHTELLRVHAIRRGIRTHKPQRAIQIGHDLLDLKPRLRAVHDHKRRVARLRPTAVTDAVVIRFPTAADDLDDARTVWLRWFEDIHRQRHAIVLGVNDIADALRLLAEKRRGDESNKEKVFHG